MPFPFGLVMQSAGGDLEHNGHTNGMDSRPLGGQDKGTTPSYEVMVFEAKGMMVEGGNMLTCYSRGCNVLSRQEESTFVCNLVYSRIPGLLLAGVSKVGM